MLVPLPYTHTLGYGYTLGYTHGYNLCPFIFFDQYLPIVPNSYSYHYNTHGYPPVPWGIPTKGMSKGINIGTLANTHTLGEGMGILEGMGKGIMPGTPGYTHANA